jgi:hypothetical protein
MAGRDARPAGKASRFISGADLRARANFHAVQHSLIDVFYSRQPGTEVPGWEFGMNRRRWLKSASAQNGSMKNLRETSVSRKHKSLSLRLCAFA